LPQAPRQRSVWLLARAWLILAVLLALMGGLAAFYNPLIGIPLLVPALVAGWRAWWHLSPPTLELAYRLCPDPDPGAVGGDVGGWFEKRDDSFPVPDAPMVTLTCIRMCERRRSQVIEHRRETVWCERRRVFNEGVDGALGFCFAPPAHLPATEPRPELVAGQWCCHHYWTVTLEGTANGRPAAQGFRIRVAKGDTGMERAPSQDQAVNNEPGITDTESTLNRVKRRISLESDETGIRFHDGPRRTARSRWLAALAGLCMVVIGAGMVAGGWLFVMVGVVLMARWLHRRGRGLRFELAGHDVMVATEWFGRALFKRRGTLSNAAELELRPAPVSVCTDLVLVNGPRRILLARDLPPEEAERLRYCLVERILPE